MGFIRSVIRKVTQFTISAGYIKLHSGSRKVRNLRSRISSPFWREWVNQSAEWSVEKFGVF
jgi:hypothetical protein